jgi:hypothetical protein
LFEDLKPAGLESVEVRSGGRAYARQLSQKSIERLETEKECPFKPESCWGGVLPGKLVSSIRNGEIAGLPCFWMNSPKVFGKSVIP